MHKAGLFWTVVALLAAFAVHPVGAAATTYVSTGAAWRYFRGLEEPSTPDTTAWREPGFADAFWATGSAPIGYGEPEVATDLAALAPPMEENYTTLYLRHRFEVADVGPPAEAEGRLLRALVEGEVADVEVDEAKLAGSRRRRQLLRRHPGPGKAGTAHPVAQAESENGDPDDDDDDQQHEDLGAAHGRQSRPGRPAWQASGSTDGAARAPGPG